MKKITAMLFVTIIMLSVVACGRESQPVVETEVETESQSVTANESIESTDITTEVSETDKVNDKDIEEKTDESSAKEESAENDATQDYTVSAIDEFEVNDFVVGEPNATSLYYTGEAQIVEYPSEFNGEPVQFIGGGDYAISMWAAMLLPGVDTVKKVVIPEGVTDLINATVVYYKKLESIELPDSLQMIHEKAFLGIKNPCTLTIPDTTEIEKKAFFDCDGLVVTYRGEEYTKDNDPNEWWGWSEVPVRDDYWN